MITMRIFQNFRGQQKKKKNGLDSPPLKAIQWKITLLHISRQISHCTPPPPHRKISNQVRSLL